MAQFDAWTLLNYYWEKALSLNISKVNNTLHTCEYLFLSHMVIKLLYIQYLIRFKPH